MGLTNWLQKYFIFDRFNFPRSESNRSDKMTRVVTNPRVISMVNKSIKSKIIKWKTDDQCDQIRETQRPLYHMREFFSFLFSCLRTYTNRSIAATLRNDKNTYFIYIFDSAQSIKMRTRSRAPQAYFIPSFAVAPLIAPLYLSPSLSINTIHRLIIMTKSKKNIDETS